MFCPKCGTKNQDTAQFCKNCGHRFQLQPVNTEQLRQTKESEKNMIRFFSIFFIILILVAILIIYIQNIIIDEGDAASNTSQTQASLETDQADSSSTDSDSSQDSDHLPTINSSESINYENTLSLNSYKTFYTDRYSFGYPLSLYEKVESIDPNGFRFYNESDEYTWLEYRMEDRDDSTSIKTKTEAIYSQLTDDFPSEEKILYKPETGLCVFCTYDRDTEQKIYHIVRVEQTSIFFMSVSYQNTDDLELDHQINYYIDCLYRMCSFGGSSYAPRTYNQFLQDDMGTKK